MLDSNDDDEVNMSIGYRVCAVEQEKAAWKERKRELFEVIKKIYRLYVQLAEEKTRAQHTKPMLGMQGMMDIWAEKQESENAENGLINDIACIAIPKMIDRLKILLGHFKHIEVEIKCSELTNALFDSRPSKSSKQWATKLAELVASERSEREHYEAQADTHRQSILAKNKVRVDSFPFGGKLLPKVKPEEVDYSMRETGKPTKKLSAPKAPSHDVISKRIQLCLNNKRLAEHIIEDTPIIVPNPNSRKRACTDLKGIRNKELRNLMVDMVLQNGEKDGRLSAEQAKVAHLCEEKLYLQETLKMCKSAISAPCQPSLGDGSGPIEDMQYNLLAAQFSGIDAEFDKISEDVPSGDIVCVQSIEALSSEFPSNLVKAAWIRNRVRPPFFAERGSLINTVWKDVHVIKSIDSIRTKVR